MDIFTAPDAWAGTWFELALELGPPDDARLRAAFEALWTFPDLEGIYLDRERDPEAQPKLSAAEVEPLRQFGRGVVHLPDGARVPCVTGVVREEGEGASDWLYLALPTGSLHRVYPPRGRAEVEAPQVEEWLVRLGRHVYARGPFALGLIGAETSGATSAAEIRKAGIPEKRYIGYLWAGAGGLDYLPRTEPYDAGFY